MKRINFAIFVMFISLSVASGAEKSIADLVEQISESVVYIEGEESCGSGFIFRTEPEVEIYTNFHVMRDDKHYMISFFLKNPQTGETEKISVPGWRYFIFPKIDFGVIKLAPDDPDVKKLLPRLKGLPMADSEGIRVGEKVFAVGSPSAGVITLGNSVSDGIIAGKNRFIKGLPYLQTTAPVNFGNSGGPLFNMKGEVVGIVTAKSVMSENVGFALPIHMTQGKNYSYYLTDQFKGEAGEAINAALNLLEQNKNEEALKPLKRIQELHPESARAFVLEGVARKRMKQIDAAEKIFENSLKMKKIKYDDEMHCIMELGLIYGGRNDTNRAIAVFLKGIERDPTNELFNRNIGIAYANMGKKSKALAHWYVSLSSNPDQPELIKLFNKLGGQD